MASLHPSELESGTIDSVASSPRSDHHDLHTSRVRFMCSFGGKILPRPHDNQLRYVGGDTRIVAVHRSTTFSALLTKLSKLAGGSNISVKYQLPNEDLDALISVTTDEDVENMMEDSISSLLDGAANREHWFFDALNSGAGLERGRSEASSIMSEVPDYLFGLDNSDETQPREPKMKSRLVLHENVSMSDPGSPAPVISSPFCSTSSAPIVPSMPDLPPVKTKPDNPVATIESKRSGQVDGYVEAVETQTQPIQPNEYSGQPMWQFVSDSHYSGPAVQQIPVYYVPGPVQPGNASVQPVSVQAQYVHQYPVPGGQMPVGYHQPVPSSGQIYGGAAVRPVVTIDHAYDPAMRVVPAEGVNQQVYYGVRNAGLVQGYPGMMMPGGEELTRTGSDVKAGRISQSS
ncbi:hypothetical protein Patl1_10919 [Pistacia atlantica]|uniref:Uncharacterized protein n=1 Tax=Pistacia atlantica TaxID=434234 RepID=A0ACC1A9V5_9ROSI|nr:hypothetical protein Patl1_10919 [Pistacia atlantica]